MPWAYLHMLQSLPESNQILLEVVCRIWMLDIPQKFWSRCTGLTGFYLKRITKHMADTQICPDNTEFDYIYVYSKRTEGHARNRKDRVELISPG